MPPANAKQIFPVFVRDSTNPKDRPILVGEKFRLSLAEGGLQLLTEGGTVRATFEWPLVSMVGENPLTEPSPAD